MFTHVRLVIRFYYSTREYRTLYQIIHQAYDIRVKTDRNEAFEMQ